MLEAALATSADSAAEHAQPSSGYAPQYVEFKEQIGGEMAAIDRKMTELRQLHGRAALTSFDDTNSNEVEIEVITQEITRLFRKCEVRLQKFGSGKSTSEADEKVKQNVQRTLASDLQKLSVKFRKQQRTYLNKLRQRDEPTRSGGSLAVLDDAPRQATEEEYDAGFSETQVLRVDGMEAFADERDREVRNILQSINDLGQIMKDLSVLVIDQGTILDRIDYNMDQVATKVDEGVQQLARAEQKQKQSRTILCIMFLVCAVIVMLIIVIVKSIVF